MKQLSSKNIIYFCGKTLGVLGLLFILYNLYQEYTLPSFLKQCKSIISILPLLYSINVASSLLGIYAWHKTFLYFSNKRSSYLVSYYYFSKTEIAKYLPGNIFHLISRQLYAPELGVSQIEMGKISILFTILIIICTLILSSLLALSFPYLLNIILYIILLISILTYLITNYINSHFSLTYDSITILILALSTILQSSILSILILYQNDNFSTILFLQFSSIYIISWLIGFITPGAAGGIGVREGIFIYLTSYIHCSIPIETLLFSIIIARFINILVDTSLFISTFLVKSTL